ncbi:MAG TPA: DUF4491 family protein [Acidobacteriota bacterium]|nr:DUF4491 family protein [Acidobacteriota bacterium]
MSLNFDGLLIAALTLAAIAFGHVFVRKSFKLFGLKFWPVSLLLGLCLLCASVFVSYAVISGGLAVWGATFLWAVREIFEMEERVSGAGNGESPQT